MDFFVIFRDGNEAQGRSLTAGLRVFFRYVMNHKEIERTPYGSPMKYLTAIVLIGCFLML